MNLPQGYTIRGVMSSAVELTESASKKKRSPPMHQLAVHIVYLPITFGIA